MANQVGPYNLAHDPGGVGQRQQFGITALWRRWFRPNGSDESPDPNVGTRPQSWQPLGGTPAFENLQGAYQTHRLRRNDWGAAGYGFTFGKILTNPIGAGVVFTQKPPITPQATAQMLNNTAFIWRIQQINQGAQPGIGPLYSPDALTAMYGPLQGVTLPGTG